MRISNWRAWLLHAVGWCFIAFLWSFCFVSQLEWLKVLPQVRWIGLGALLLTAIAIWPRPFVTRDDLPLLLWALALIPCVVLAENRTLAWSGKGGPAWIGYRDLVFPALAWYGIAARSMTVPRLRWLSRGLVAGACFAAAIGYLEAATHHNVLYEYLHPQWAVDLPYLRYMRERRIMGTQSHPVLLGTLLAICIPLAVHQTVVAGNRWKRLWLGGLTAALIGALVLTYTRGSLLALLVALAAYAILQRQRRWLLALPILLLLVVMGSTAQSFITNTAHRGSVGSERLSLAGLRTLAQHRHAGWRIKNALLALRMTRQRPVWGYGLNHYPYLYDRYGNPQEVMKITDNSYLSLLVEAGVLGFGSLLWVFWSGCQDVRRAAGAAVTFADRSLIAAYGASWLAVATHLATFDGLYWMLPGVFFWSGVGLLRACAAGAPPTAAVVISHDHPA